MLQERFFGCKRAFNRDCRGRDLVAVLAFSRGSATCLSRLSKCLFCSRRLPNSGRLRVGLTSPRTRRCKSWKSWSRALYFPFKLEMCTPTSVMVMGFFVQVERSRCGSMCSARCGGGLPGRRPAGSTCSASMRTGALFRVRLALRRSSSKRCVHVYPWIPNL